MTRKIWRRPRRGQCVLPAMMFLALLFPQGAVAQVVEISYWDYIESRAPIVVRFQGAAGDRIRVQVWRFSGGPVPDWMVKGAGSGD